MVSNCVRGTSEVCVRQRCRKKRRARSLAYAPVRGWLIGWSSSMSKAYWTTKGNGVSSMVEGLSASPCVLTTSCSRRHSLAAWISM